MDDTLSEILMFLTGIVSSIVLDRLFRFQVSRLIDRVRKRFNSSRIHITQDTPSVKVARWFAAIIPSWMWLVFTWSIFIAGYVSMSSWKSTAVWLAHFVACKYASLTQKLMLDVGWYTFTIWQSVQLCVRDYEAFANLGVGGTPQTWNGFKRVTLLEWFGNINTQEAPQSVCGKGHLKELEQRSGDRPKVVGIAPQRQLDQRAPKHVYDYLLIYLDHLSAENSSRIRTTTSFLEKHANALLANTNCVVQPIFRTFGCEIVHPHKVDGSLHCMLHPNDIEKVIRAGWGERHSIARAESWWMI